jgi:hypothetical protein
VLAYSSWSWAYRVGRGVVVVVLVGAGAGSGSFARALVGVHAHIGLFAVVLVSVRAVTHAAAAFQSDVKRPALILLRAGTVCPFAAVLAGIGGRTAATHTLAVVLTEDGRGWWWNRP